MRVLLIEDDPMIGAAVEASLKDAAYAVDWIRDGGLAMLAAESESYALILLDLGLPRRDGLAILADIRGAGHNVPVLILTARDAVDDRIRGLDGGADDYLTKPFAMSELLARMRAVLRRPSVTPDPVLRSATLTLDPATRVVSVGEEVEVRLSRREEVRLSRREFALLEALMARPGTILSRAQLEAHVYGWGEEVESNAIEFLLHTLRKKLGTGHIKNVRGVGWMVSARD
ncbi:response regulator transcription factor [Salinisphaera hydrothermalis]|uniref:response regulator transcription factor n=1 Tax=Salinisphaera hydrothermalis TaxID=563188 RepID=UPI0033407D67